MSAPTISAACTTALLATNEVAVTCGLLAGIDPNATFEQQIAAASLSTGTPEQLACACTPDHVAAFTGVVTTCAADLKLDAAAVANATTLITSECAKVKAATGTAAAPAKPTSAGAAGTSAATAAATKPAAPAASSKSSAEAIVMGLVSVLGAVAFL
ncbi:hypothetical protein HDU77_005893 [Chytriomyces hyalinus]|nr:hypothetical protein HDU77_005893 [Chytriomyces hyalinus]